MGRGNMQSGVPEQAKPGLLCIWIRRRARQMLRCMSGCCGFCLDCMDTVLRVLGPLMVLLAVCLIGFVAYTFFTIIIPHLSDRTSTPMLLMQMALGCFLLVNVMYNYTMAVCLRAGQPPPFPGDAEKDAELGQLGECLQLRQCHKCLLSKPLRAHHCSVCKQCVLKMDHHCPWINNCVGFNNYRYFCLFMLYLALGCLYVVLLGYPLFLEAASPTRRRSLELRFADAQCVSLSWLVSLCIFLALCILGGFHMYLVLTNQTTIEFHINMSNGHAARRKGEVHRNPYDLGRSRNFQEVFGPNRFFGFIWMMPYLAKKPAGNGCSFPMVFDLHA